MTVCNKVSCYYRHMMLKKILQTIIFIIFCDSLMMDQSFLSPQVKRCAIMTYKRARYEFSHEVPNVMN